MCSKLSTFSQNSGEVHSSNSFELFAMLLTGLVLGPKQAHNQMANGRFPAIKLEA